MAVVLVNRCPLCGVFLKPENLRRHIERVHPRYSYGVAKVSVDLRTCPICGNKNDPSRTKYGLSICNTHYVKEVRRFSDKAFLSYVEREKQCGTCKRPVCSVLDAKFAVTRSQRAFRVGA